MDGADSCGNSLSRSGELRTVFTASVFVFFAKKCPFFKLCVEGASSSNIFYFYVFFLHFHFYVVGISSVVKNKVQNHC
jgi:hypothetical protein